MPPNRAPSQRTLDTNLLEPEALVAPGGLQTALRSIQNVCYRDDSSIMEMIVELSNRPHILEYTFSSTSCTPVFHVGLIERTVPVALDNQAYERLSKWTIARFPTSATLNVKESLGIKLLQRLSSSLIPVEGVSTAEHRNELREFRRKVDLSLNVLEELGGSVDRASVSPSTSPTSRKRPKALARRIQLDPHPFDCLGIAVPTTEDEVRAVRGDILPRLQRILGVRDPYPFGLLRTLTRFQHYLLILRRPRVSDVFKRQFKDLGATQSIKADLCFEGVEGFGEWRILLSNKAEKYLRQAGRGNGVMLEIVLKKTK